MAIVIGFVGQLSSGKDTVVDYVKDHYGAEVFGFSKILKEILKTLDLEQTRDNYVKVSEIVREHFGDDILSKVMAKRVLGSDADIIAVDGVRRKTDVLYLKNNPDFYLVNVFADPKVRYERLTKRTEKKDDQGKTWEEFLEDHKKSTEVTIQEVAEMADFSIDNNGTLEELYANVDEVMSKVKK